MDYNKTPEIFETLSGNLEPRPRTILVISELLEISYKLLEHPILQEWNGFEKIDPFENALSRNPELYKVYNRTIVERTISQGKYYASIPLETGTLIMSSKGIELSISVLKEFLIIANEIHCKTIDEISDEYSSINMFRLYEGGSLNGTVQYLLTTCIQFIELILTQYLKQELKKSDTDKEKRKMLLRWEADLDINKDQYPTLVYDSLKKMITIELSYLKKLNEDVITNDMLSLVESFLSQAKARATNYKLVASLLEDNMEDFTDILTDLVLHLFSYHDIAGNEPEKVYHAFFVGLFFNGFSDVYKITSNRESGTGRFDILMMPIQSGYKGVIIEVKKTSVSDTTQINLILNEALNQIISNKYYMELKQAGVETFYSIAALFHGKQLYLSYKENYIPEI